VPITELETPNAQYLKTGHLAGDPVLWRVTSVDPTRSWRQVFSLLALLVDRELTATYKRSVLGTAWALITPLLQLFVISFTFHSVLGTHIEGYASFTFLGLMVWNWFQSSLIDATGCVVKNHRLVNQPGLQREILPAVSISTQLIHFVMCLPLLLILMNYADGISVGPTIVWLPLLIVLQFLFTLGLSYPLAALNVRFRDTKHILGIVLNLGLFLTPVFYSAATFPQHWLFLECNPLTGLLASYRGVILYGQAPNFSSLALITALTFAGLPLGALMYKIRSMRFLEDL